MPERKQPGYLDRQMPDPVVEPLRPRAKPKPRKQAKRKGKTGQAPPPAKDRPPE